MLMVRLVLVISTFYLDCQFGWEKTNQVDKRKQLRILITYVEKQDVWTHYNCKNAFVFLFLLNFTKAHIFGEYVNHSESFLFIIFRNL